MKKKKKKKKNFNLPPFARKLKFVILFVALALPDQSPEENIPTYQKKKKKKKKKKIMSIQILNI